MSDRIIFTTFTDPMMGLTYEMEPIYDRLKQEYGDKIEFRWVMSLLVRDVSDFMTPRERAMEPEAGIRAYNARLAQIYKSEEAVGGLPINMEGFCLFDPEHRTSKPLNLAYKAAQLADPEKADDFLLNLRHATVIDCRPTTQLSVILDVVRSTGIDEDAFLRHYNDGSAEAALERDLALTCRLRIRSLPTCLIQRGDKALLMDFVVIPGSRNVDHIRDNLNILDFTLTDDEMAEIAKLDKGERYYHRTDEQLDQFAAWRPEYEKA